MVTTLLEIPGKSWYLTFALEIPAMSWNFKIFLTGKTAFLKGWSCFKYLGQFQLSRTGTRYGFEILHQRCKRVKTKSHKVWGDNS